MTHQLASPRRSVRTVRARWLAAAVAVLALQIVGVQAAGAATPVGTPYAWGANAYGELGNNSVTNSSTPVAVSGILNGVVKVAAGARHSLAIVGDGTVRAWGRNASGELGNGTTTESHVPVAVSGFGAGSGVISVAGNAPPISSTAVSGAGHSMALKSDGSVWGWGHGNSGQVGDGVALPLPASTNHDVLAPVRVVGLGPNSTNPVTVIAAGGAHSLAVKKDGSVWAWGHDASGQLGDGAALPGADHSSPVQVVGFGPSAVNPVVGIAAGDSFSLARKKDGSIWAWGNNASGQLGNNSTSDRSTPAVVSGLTSGFIRITAGAAFGVALKTDGSVWAWGNNQSGQLGNNGAPNDQHVPVAVSGLGAASGVSTISAGFSHVIALKSNRTLLVWGRNASGQLGDGTTTQRNTPKALGLTAIAQISAGGAHTLVARAPTVTVTPSRGPIGASVNVAGSRFRPGETVHAYYQTRLSAPSPSQVLVCSAVVTSSTTSSCSGNIPTTDFGPLGPHAIVQTGAASGLTATATFTLTPTVAVTPNAGHAGAPVTVSGSRFAPSESVKVYWLTKLASPSQILLCTATTTSAGALSCTATIPTTNQGPLGAHTITATGAASNVAGTTTFTLQ
jgi:alpha-tubulin suppressor-like RCC1 family protein